MRKLSRLLIALSLLVITSFGIVNADDFEYWSTYSIDAKINDRLKLKAVEQLRINEDISRFYTNVIYFGPVYKLNDVFSVGALYKNVQKRGNNEWTATNGVVFDLYTTNNLQDLSYFFPNINWWDIDIKGRTRMEYNGTHGTWLYRVKIGISKDFKIAERIYTPYIENETFVSLNDNFDYNQNRASVGIGTDFLFDTKIKVWYMSRTRKSEKWTNSNIIGTTLSYKF
jgi:hypothetical protein